jgi:hypothetical protein
MEVWGVDVKRTLVPAVLLCLMLAFALLALYSPVKFLPGIPTCNQSQGLKVTMGNPDRCAIVLKNYKPETVAEVAGTPVWFYWSYAEIAEGLAVVGALTLIWVLKPRVPASFSRPLSLPKALSKSMLLASIVLGVLYFWTVAIDVAYAGFPSLRPYATWCIKTFFAFHSFQAQGSSLGVMGFLFLAVATVGFFVCGLPKGLLNAVRDSILRFAAPAVLILMVGLLLFDFREMPTHATNFAVWSVPYHDSIYLVSNWFVLIVAASLAFLGLSPLLIRKQGVGR